MLDDARTVEELSEVEEDTLVGKEVEEIVELSDIIC